MLLAPVLGRSLGRHHQSPRAARRGASAPKGQVMLRSLPRRGRLSLVLTLLALLGAAIPAAAQTVAGGAVGSQRSLRSQLGARGVTYQPFWVVNAGLVHGTLADAQAIAGRADVALVRANHTMALPREPANLIGVTERCSPDQP